MANLSAISMLVMHNINEDMNNKWLFNFIQGPWCYLFCSCAARWADHHGRDRLPLSILCLHSRVSTQIKVFSQNDRSKMLIFKNPKEWDRDMWAWVAGAGSSDMESTAGIWEGEIIHCGLISVKKPLIGLIGGNPGSRGNMDLWKSVSSEWWHSVMILHILQ